MRYRLMLYCLGITILAACSGAAKDPAEHKPIQRAELPAGDTVTEMDGEIRSLFRDTKNNLWVATNGDGVFKYDGKIITRFTAKHGLPGNFVWDIGEGKDGKTWFRINIRPGDTDVICCFDGKAFKTVQANADQQSGHNYLGEELFPGYYYTGSALVKIQLPHTSALKNAANARHHYDIYCSCRDREGNLWFGTCTAGVCKYNGKTYTWLTDKELGAPVRAIFEDRNGMLWIGTNGNGLFRYDGKMLSNFSKEQRLENDDPEKYPSGKAVTLSRIWTITDDKEGNLWIGTIDNGAWKFDGNTITNYTAKDGLGADAIWTIYRDNKGRLFFGTDGFGVYTFNGNAFDRFTAD